MTLHFFVFLNGVFFFFFFSEFGTFAVNAELWLWVQFGITGLNHTKVPAVLFTIAFQLSVQMSVQWKKSNILELLRK